MLEPIQNYFQNKDLKLKQSRDFLRQSFVFFFSVQIILAIIISLIFSFFKSPRAVDSLIVTLILMSVLQLPLATFMGLYFGKKGGKKAALSATIVTAMLFSNPAWFAGFGFLSSKSVFYLFIQILILAIYYAIGILIAGQFAKISLINNDSSK